MRRVGVLLAIAAVVGIAGAGAVVLDGGDEHPDEWDERVADLIDYVEDERGHEFEHPVAIDFLDDAAYAELARSDAAALTDEELDEIDDAEGLLRALGLVSGDIDLLESVNDLSDTGTLAYYDFEEERVVVRGTEVTPGLAVTLVHELTHVLQDQVFDLGRLVEDEDATSGELFAFRALVEGDAQRIEARYLESLDAEDQAAVEAESAGDIEAVESEEIPVALQALFSSPYALGSGFVDLLDETDDGAIDEAFADPPATEEHLLDPPRYIDGDAALPVEAPSTDGAEVIDDGDFGAASLFLVLAERIDMRQALDAALGWGGDAYVAFERDGRTCLRLSVIGDSASDDDELTAALASWVAAAPAGSASTARDGDIVRLESCDPGVDAAGGSGAGIGALTLAATRTVIITEFMASGPDLERAVCFADGVIDAFSPEQLTGEALPPGFQETVSGIAASCL